LTALWWVLEGALMLAAPQRVLERPDAGKHLCRMNLVAIPVAVALTATGVMELG
jgi:hypothetical protein